MCAYLTWVVLNTVFYWRKNAVALYCGILSGIQYEYVYALSTGNKIDEWPLSKIQAHWFLMPLCCTDGEIRLSNDSDAM